MFNTTALEELDDLGTDKIAPGFDLTKSHKSVGEKAAMDLP